MGRQSYSHSIASTGTELGRRKGCALWVRAARTVATPGCDKGSSQAMASCSAEQQRHRARRGAAKKRNFTASDSSDICKMPLTKGRTFF